MSLGPGTRLYVAKRVPRSFATVPIRQFGLFWDTFWKTLGSKVASKEEFCFRCTFGFEIVSKFDGFWYQIRGERRRYFVRSSEKRKVDF